MKTISVNYPKVQLVKRAGLLAFILAAPLAAMAQYVVFTDSFNNGSTVNHTSVPGGTPFASFTSYDIASAKNATNTPIGSGKFRVTLVGATTGGFVEAQALFTPTPVSLNTIGDYITLTYTFTNTAALLAAGSGSYIYNGLYNSGGVPPVPGSLANAGLAVTSGSPFATGNCADWQGYCSRVSSNGTSEAYTRPFQNGAGTAAGNQDLVGNGTGTGSYANPTGVVFDSNETATVTLTPGQLYTVSYTIALTAAGTLTVTNGIYSGSVVTNTAQVFLQTNTAPTTNVLTTSFDGLALGYRNSGTSLDPIMDITNITITESIAGLPGQPYDVTGGGSGCLGGSFLVGLDGSVTSNSYFLYTNGVWNGQQLTGTGSALSFGNQTIISTPLTYTVVASNTVNSNIGLMIGSTVVQAFALPNITNQPIPAVVANGSIGVFSLGASGGGLTYQWFKNGTLLTNGLNISGATNSTLVISPAGSGDVASYYCTVTDGCGFPTNSTTNGLTLDSAANLVWKGTISSNWDLSTTANFNNGSSVVFHNGDNVTLDDTATAFQLSIANNFIAPSSITESASSTYVVRGPGVIQGPGSLLMSGAGILSINNSNAYSGGTTMNNGTVIMSNQFALGTGTITMTGGTFEIPSSPGSAAGLSNNINAASGTSTLSYNANGTYACVLNGAVAGSSGATLNFNSLYATVPSTSRLRLYGVFTNNANIVLNSAGSEIEFAPYLPSGNQLWAGVISGTGGHIVARGAGVAIFGGANTFNDSGLSPNQSGISLLMSSGNIGFGADSVSTVPPTIDSSPAGTGLIGINVGTEGGTCSLFTDGGAHTIGNQIAYTSATNTVTVRFGGSNPLTFTGEFDLANTAISGTTIPTDTQGTNRTLDVTNEAATTFAGVITDNNAINTNSSLPPTVSGITKTGGGALYLNGTNIYVGPTTNNGGLLSGSGSIAGPVIVTTNGNIGGGPAGTIGTLTISNNLTLNGGVLLRVDKDLAPGQSNDTITVTGSLSSGGTGTVTVTNIGATGLVPGDSFQIFNAPVAGAGTMTVTGGTNGAVWTNRLAIDGSIALLSIGTGPATNPTNITFSVVNGTNLSLTWPPDHQGWTLQTNPVGVNSWSNWFAYPGSTTVTNVILNINKANKNVFYRLNLVLP